MKKTFLSIFVILIATNSVYASTSSETLLDNMASTALLTLGTALIGGIFFFLSRKSGTERDKKVKEIESKHYTDENMEGYGLAISNPIVTSDIDIYLGHLVSMEGKMINWELSKPKEQFCQKFQSTIPIITATMRVEAKKYGKLYLSEIGNDVPANAPKGYKHVEETISMSRMKMIEKRNDER